MSCTRVLNNRSHSVKLKRITRKITYASYIGTPAAASDIYTRVYIRICVCVLCMYVSIYIHIYVYKYERISRIELRVVCIYILNDFVSPTGTSVHPENGDTSPYYYTLFPRGVA